MSNSWVQSDPCGLGWTYVMGWIGLGWIFFDSSWWVWSKNLLNPTHAHPYLVDAILKAKELGFRRVLIHSNSRRLEQVCNKLRTPSWQEQTIMSDLHHLQQQGMFMHSIFIPKSVVLHAIVLASLTTNFLVHHCRLYPTSM